MRHSYPFGSDYSYITAGSVAHVGYAVFDARDRVSGALEAQWWREIARAVYAQGFLIIEWLTVPEIPDDLRGAMFVRYAAHMQSAARPGHRATITRSARAMFADLMAEEAEGE